jgi:carbamoyl-phosphate synthase large subunit/carbamoyl-phosphate synthase small subunit
MPALRLADGTCVTGTAFGDTTASAEGEVVFYTGMVGYPEALTDPSYAGQILVLTYPLVGNYGVPSNDCDEYGLPLHFESDRIHVRGLVVADYTAEYSHWNARSSLGDWLQAHGVPALYGVDTRLLAKRLRDAGAMRGSLACGPNWHPRIERPLVAVTDASAAPRVYHQGAHPRIVVLDCGMKHHILRRLLRHRPPMEVRVVPYDFPLADSGVPFDAVFVSNGPGDPTDTDAVPALTTLRWVLARTPVVPVFGICLGHQLLALAAGASTYKMKFGNRGMNQPCIDLRTTRCYITPQNHGYAVDDATLPADWKPLFVNANDHTNEGILHDTHPWMGVQFHPEACGGPTDTSFLFDEFFDRVRGVPPKVTVVDYATYRRKTYKKVLLLGSGGLSIGQAGEFDYSGSQAIKALQEEGVEVVLVNPNIATVQTSKGMADHVYFLPVDAPTVTRVIAKERPDGILVSMGGQTALNVGLALHRAGVFAQYGVDVLGTPISAIEDTEDRQRFAERLAEIGETIARSESANDVPEAIAAAERIGYPVLVRAAFTLGGLGSGFAADAAELTELATKAFACSHQILIDQDLRGWKELEYEVVRDRHDNCITVCNMENFDPLGIHTGDSIVVCPSQTLSNREYFMLRAVAQKVVRHLGVVGECNIQYALSPNSEEYCIIEVNARLSRSSALASKATGYPLAYVATKLALGADLARLPNAVTETTSACFEPALDYCVVKMPRWDLQKFARVSTALGSSMLSVGEVMAIGRTFEETIQKAVRMVNPTLDGLQACRAVAAVRAEVGVIGATDADDAARTKLDALLGRPTDSRLFAVCAALDAGYTVDRVHALTRIDRWYLHKLRRLSTAWAELQELTEASLTLDTLRALKGLGFSDGQIARGLGGTNAEDIRRARCALGVTPWVKQIDTVAAEFPARTNYLYTTYHGAEHDVRFGEPDTVLVLGCGAYCIGSSVEFDWCAVSAVQTLREAGHQAVVINCNPETVSTDYDESDRLYFEELSLERVRDVYELERAAGVVVSVGGQVPNTLALPLHQHGVTLLGTPADSIDRCEDRNRFSAMCDAIEVKQPPWREVATAEEAAAFAADVGYPVLVRPSYVLSGAAMKVATTREELDRFLRAAGDVSGGAIVVSKFILDAKEMEFDAVAKDGLILNYALSEHVENAGVHSGDATLVLPAQKLYVETFRQVKRIAARIAEELRITGPFNVQLMARDNDVQVIECNLRASRTFPFISKTFDLNFVGQATRAMIGLPVKRQPMALMEMDYVGVKVAQFSFTRLQGADPTLGVEMASTGEVACFATDVHTAYLQALQATGFQLPDARTRNRVLVSIGSVAHKLEFLASARLLVALGYVLYATPGTATYFAAHGVEGVVTLRKPDEGGGPESKQGDVVTALRTGGIDVVINVAGTGERGCGYLIRRTAVDFGLPMLTNIKTATLFCAALAKGETEGPVRSMGEMYAMG